MTQLVRVENETDALMNFPPCKESGVPAFNLGPGGNNIPLRTVEALEAGKVKKRGLLKDWRAKREAGLIKVHDVETSAVLTKKAEGPTAPINLVGRTPAAACAIVKVTSDVELLQLWAKAEARRPKVAQAIADRLMQLGAG